jgi:hypothetical protein|tara:strand:+ start:503 stop:622 length:120 start_codon:yes stop_codon:yes gene_type:complete
MEYILDVFILMIIIVGLCCALVTQDFAKEVNETIDREIK